MRSHHVFNVFVFINLTCLSGNNFASTRLLHISMRLHEPQCLYDVNFYVLSGNNFAYP